MVIICRLRKTKDLVEIQVNLVEFQVNTENLRYMVVLKQI